MAAVDIQEIRLKDREALEAATFLLQRARRSHETTGIWEAADVQWNSRKPRVSDHAEQLFWFDHQGPVAGILLTSTNEKSWQIDPIVLAGQENPASESVWLQMYDHIVTNPDIAFEIPVSDDDELFTRLAIESGCIASSQDFTGWMSAEDAPQVQRLPDGFRLVDRVERDRHPHPMAHRNGNDLADRLRRCSLYDPSLDLEILAANGRTAGYSLYWFDPVTRVGLIEPVRILDDFQRRGLAKVMLSHGIDRLIRAGANRIKVSWQTAAAGALYVGVGFTQTSTTTWYSLPD